MKNLALLLTVVMMSACASVHAEDKPEVISSEQVKKMNEEAKKTVISRDVAVYPLNDNEGIENSKSISLVNFGSLDGKDQLVVDMDCKVVVAKLSGKEYKALELAKKLIKIHCPRIGNMGIHKKQKSADTTTGSKDLAQVKK